MFDSFLLIENDIKDFEASQKMNRILFFLYIQLNHFRGGILSRLTIFVAVFIVKKKYKA